MKGSTLQVCMLNFEAERGVTFPLTKSVVMLEMLAISSCG